MIDLRSDTVTRPTAAMRQAMSQAPVGDDVWGDDPTVAAFEAAVAEKAALPAALFFPSGTQSNLAALMTHCQRGDEFICGQQSHIYRDEGGGAASLGGIHSQPIEHAADGSLPLDKVRAAIKGHDIHHARTRLIALENTFRGKVMTEEYLTRATGVARTHGLATHLDGARLFNASVASGRPLASLCRGFDTVSLCFSKGLGAPVGSLLLGGQDFIARARRWRKTLGGGMRQVGILAAGCQHALDHHVERLADDHRHAEQLAAGLANIEGVEVLACDTNMVFVSFPEAHCGGLGEFLEARGVLMAVAPVTRLVTHLDVSKDDVRHVVASVEAYFSQ
ncbi:MAG TPA: low-specificity L-threonine aldolase [Halomonas sp.]|nr:low-specificity L-threonine aldolase [Halomonas sp.]